MTDPWSDVVAYYKAAREINVHLRIFADEVPAVDTGGVRRQVFTEVLHCFANNEPFPLFDGTIARLRPRTTAVVRSSGLLRILGVIVAHSICQDGIGFSFSPTCFWYIVDGQNKALQFASIEDLPADAANIVIEVLSGSRAFVHFRLMFILMQITEATTQETLMDIANSSLFVDVSQRCGIMSIPTVSDIPSLIGLMLKGGIISYEAVYKLSKLLDEIQQGLKDVGIMKLLRAFPELLLKLLTSASKLCAADVLAAVCIPEGTSETVSSYLTSFINETEIEGKI